VSDLVSVLSRKRCGSIRRSALTAFQYNSSYSYKIGGQVRKCAVLCGKAKMTFRVRCIQPGSATSPRMEHSVAVQLAANASGSLNSAAEIICGTSETKDTTASLHQV